MSCRAIRQILWLPVWAVAGAVSAQDTRTLTEPVVPPVCSVLTAVQSSPAAATRIDDTRRIQNAIEACVRGHAVRLAIGNGKTAFVAGALVLKSGVTLLVDAGVTLFAITDPLAYDRGQQTCGTNSATGKGCTPFITADRTTGSGIMGEGVIDGQGGQLIDGKTETWWQIARRAQKEQSHQNVPRLIEISNSSDFNLHRITLRNSPNFHVTLNRVDGFTAWSVKIDTPADSRNTDGIDPISSRNITIAHSFIRTGDDNVAIKAGSNGPTENISILHNHFYNGHGMSIGSETYGGVRNVLVEDLTMDGATSGLRIKSDVSRGGKVSNVRYRDVCLTNVRAPLDIDTRYDKKATGNKIPSYRDIVFERVHSITPGRITLRGFNATYPLTATLNDVVIDGNPTMQIEHARLTLGPGPVQPLPAGDGAEISGTPSSGAGKSCDGAFVEFPALPPPISATRPQLTAREAEMYAYAEVLKTTGPAGSESSDPWDPVSDPLTTGVAVKSDYVVDAAATANGKTVFNTVQAAVHRAVSDQSTSGRKSRIIILVKPGTYRELVYVPRLSAPITLTGSDANAANTVISANLDALVAGSKYSQAFGGQFVSAPPDIKAMFDSLKDRATISTSGSATAWIRNEGFQASNLTFENSYNKVRPGATASSNVSVVSSQAVALVVDDADKVQFENVRFLGLQDTLYLKSSSPARTARIFFNKSYIEGDVDFIFGDATAYFYQSEIKSLGARRISYVTAPSTHLKAKYGFVFDTCKFTHDGSPNALAGNFKLGRQWFRNQRCTPFGTVAHPVSYQCRLGELDVYEAPVGSISKGVLETVGKVIVLNSQIGTHIDRASPWADWNANGTIKHRPVQYSSDDFWHNLTKVGIDPVRQLGLNAQKIPPDPFLGEFKNTDD